LLGKTFWACAHRDFIETVRERGRARLRGENVPNQYECKFVTKGGDSFWAIISVGCIEYKGKPTGIVTIIDITDTKRAEEELQASLAEKEVLLKEVHHRVKNNLQIISSLLELQSDYITDDRSCRFLRESQDRIKSMALIHERLYESRDLASINLAGYIDDLCGHLFHSYFADPGRIRLKVDAEDMKLSIDKAIPCGLIINELVSNCLKHAFPDGRDGEIIICLHAGSGNRITLSVADNGVGLPPDLDFRKTATLGLQLVNMLTKQLQGHLETHNDHGAVFTLWFQLCGR
jgi:two-component sensor histidine kinase